VQLLSRSGLPLLPLPLELSSASFFPAVGRMGSEESNGGRAGGFRTKIPLPPFKIFSSTFPFFPDAVGVKPVDEGFSTVGFLTFFSVVGRTVADVVGIVGTEKVKC